VAAGILSKIKPYGNKEEFLFTNDGKIAWIKWVNCKISKPSTMNLAQCGIMPAASPSEGAASRDHKKGGRHAPVSV
jgi:hypothetical protein